MNAGCSRRALLKQRKLCHQCHRRPASLVETDSTTDDQLRFCSTDCIQQYKMQIFTAETLACLKGTVGQSECAVEEDAHASDSDDVVNMIKMDNNNEKLSEKPTNDKCVDGWKSGSKRGSKLGALAASTSRKSKRRASQQRPHPSYALNKRYWEELKLKNCNNAPVNTNQPTPPPQPTDKTGAPEKSIKYEDSTCSSYPAASNNGPPPKLARIVVAPPCTNGPPLPLPPLRQMPVPVSGAPPPTCCIHGCPPIYVPVPIPIPMPFPVPTEKFAESVITLGTYKR